MTGDLLHRYLNYLAAREAERETWVKERLGRLTAREQTLVAEAAVMGYVQGKMSGSDSEVPSTSVIVREVLLGARAMKDLYPQLGGSAAA